MIIENVLEFFFDGWGKFAMAIGGIITLVTAFALDRYKPGGRVGRQPFQEIAMSR